MQREDREQEQRPPLDQSTSGQKQSGQGPTLPACRHLSAASTSADQERVHVALAPELHPGQRAPRPRRSLAATAGRERGAAPATGRARNRSPTSDGSFIHSSCLETLRGEAHAASRKACRSTISQSGPYPARTSRPVICGEVPSLRKAVPRVGGSEEVRVQARLLHAAFPAVPEKVLGQRWTLCQQQKPDGHGDCGNPATSRQPNGPGPFCENTLDAYQDKIRSNRGGCRLSTRLGISHRRPI